MAEQMPCGSTGHKIPNAWEEDQPHSNQERGFFLMHA